MNAMLIIPIDNKVVFIMINSKHKCQNANYLFVVEKAPFVIRINVSINAIGL